MAFAGDQKDQVQQATDLVRLIGEHVALRQKGREWAGLCPFHDDKNPSMYVNPQKQIFKCFVCGEGGDVFSWQMKFHRMEFREALASLADRAGIELRHTGSGSGNPAQAAANKGMRQRIHAANDQALNFYRHSLKDAPAGKVARDYVDRRGIHPDMVDAFQLGYAPDGWDALATAVGRQRWDRDAFEQAGLIALRKQGQGHYDKLRHRLIFPICDAMGRPIAFGGRKLRDEDEPKYLNSPETILFNKSRTLYGLHLAKKAIIDSHAAVIVEGYTDVIACHQAGAKNVLATLGTAFTAEHVTELRRFAEKVVLVYDGDEAGQKAAERAVDIFLHGDMDVAIAVLPGGADPAELLAEEDGLDQWRQCVAAAAPAMDFLLAAFRRSLENIDTITGVQHRANDFVARLADLGLGKVDPVRRSLIVQRLANTLGMNEGMINDLLLEQSRKVASRKRNPTAPPSPQQQPESSPAIWENTAYNLASNIEGEYSGQPSQTDATSDHPAPDGLSRQDADAWASKVEATVQAERDVIGCMLQDNALFELVMDDGRTVDELVTPGDMQSPVARRLYQRLYDRLADGRAATVATLAGELAEEGLHDLVTALTDADVDVEQRTENDPRRRTNVLKGAVRFFVSQRIEHEYRTTHGGAVQPDAPTADDENERLRRMQEMLRSRQPNPARIVRRAE